jgi:uncharacterized membrane protein YgaE (UPF0421/DUF939 family)
MTFAQTGGPVDGISGGAGWAGAGLLGLVLAWLLLKYLPDKDKQISDFHIRKDALVQSIVENFGATLREHRTEWHAAVDDIKRHNEAQVHSLARAMQVEFARINNNTLNAISAVSGDSAVLERATGTKKAQHGGGRNEPPEKLP